MRPNTKAPVAVTLKLNGYSTAQFGKCHEVPVWQSSPMGPFDAWPSGGGGFETFYGFIGGENNQWDPALYDGTTPVEPPATPEEGYHLTEDLTDRAVSWIRQQKALMPDKPFFVYFAPGATHAPHHVPKEWADRYAGAFDEGWDVQRERTFARQKELGVIPADAELTARHAEIPAWDDMPDEMKPVLAREMEVYAGFLEHTDYHVGRLIDVLDDLEILDDTLVYYIIGDNGASAEGTLNGAFNEMANFNGMAALETPEFMMSKLDEFGSPSSYNHIATVITSSPGLMPSAIRARRSASVPDATEIACRAPASAGEFGLEASDLRAEDEGSALEHARDGALDLPAAREEAPARIGLRNLRQFAVFHSAQKPYIRCIGERARFTAHAVPLEQAGAEGRDGAMTDRRSFLKGLSGAALSPAIAFAQADDPLQQLIQQNQRSDMGQGFDSASRTIQMPKILAADAVAGDRAAHRARDRAL